MHALEEHRDPDSLVAAYFDRDREIVIEAARQTLEATRQDADPVRIAETVDRELIDALRFPTDPRGGLLPTLYVHRGKVAGALVTVLLGLVAVLLL